METIREEYDDFLQEKERIINRANEYVGNDVQRMMHRLQASAVRDPEWECIYHNILSQSGCDGTADSESC